MPVSTHTHTKKNIDSQNIHSQFLAVKASALTTHWANIDNNISMKYYHKNCGLLTKSLWISSHIITVCNWNSANLLFANHIAKWSDLWSLQAQYLCKMEQGGVCLYIRGQRCVRRFRAQRRWVFDCLKLSTRQYNFCMRNGAEYFAFRTCGLITR